MTPNLIELYPIVPGVGIEAATRGSAGIDLHLCNIKKVYSTNNVEYPDSVTEFNMDLKMTQLLIIPPKRRLLVGTGIALKSCERNLELQVRPRSGNSLKLGLNVYLGTIDADYIDKEIGVIVENTSDTYVHLPHLYKIAQLVVSPILEPQLVVGVLVNEEIRTGGFGSTDKS